VSKESASGVSEELVGELASLSENCSSVIVSCCFETLVAEAGNSLGTQRKGNVSMDSRYQAMVNGDCNRLRTLVCVW
jgi:hypothetical protein